MLQSPFKSMVARTAIFALVLALAISFVTVGLAPSASAQQANEDPCEQNASTKAVTCDYDENDDAPVANFSALDPEGEMIVWSLTGDDAEDFDITGGVLSFSSSPNFEDPKGSGTPADNSYDVMVVATEVRAPGSLDLAQSNEISVTVNVKNVEEPYTFTLDRLQVRASADTSGGTTLTSTLTDPDVISASPAPTYQWYVPKVSRPDLENDNHWTTAGNSTSTGQTYAPVSTDAGKHLRVVATYTDGIGPSEKAYARTAYPVVAALATGTTNNPPAFPQGTTTSFRVGEHAPVGTVVGTVRGADIDSNDILTHTLAGASGTENEGKFAIDPATGRITVKAKLNFETAPDATGGRTGKEYTVTVSLFDPSTATGITQEVIIAVTDENDAPMRPTVGVVTDNNRTPLDPDDATAPSYKIDENTPVKDVAEDTNVTPNIAAEFAIVIATFTVTDGTDPDGGTSATEGDPADTLKLTVEGVDGGLFDLTNTTAAGGDATDDTYELVFKEEPNYESPADADGNNRYHVTIVTTDNEGAKSSLPLVITVENVEETGMVSLSTTQPAVGQAITASLTDPDMKISDVEWQWSRSLTDTPGSFIAIQGATSDTYTPIRSVEDDPITSENEGVDGDEGMYLEVTVSYRDNASEEGTAGDREIKKPTDNAVRRAPEVNQAPVFESGITREVREDAGDGGKVGSKVAATDPDAGDALTYRISGGADMGAFAISSDGQITVKKGDTLDFEGSQTTFVVEVTARDPFGLEDSTTVTITVTDFNEMPELTAPGDPCEQNASTKAVTCDYDENGMDPVGSFSAMDPEGEMVVWSLSGDDAEDFDITDGVLSFSSSPNFEDPKGSGTPADNSYEVEVVATEVRPPGSLDVAQSNSIMVTVNVENVEEPYTFTLDRLQVRASADTSGGTTLTSTLTDPDVISTSPAPTYQWYVPKVNRPDLENDDHWTTAGNSTSTGQTYAPVSTDAGKHLRVVATYTDGIGPSEKAYARTAYPVVAALATGTTNNPPAFPQGTTTSFRVGEHAPVGTVVGTVRGADIDSNDILTHTLAGASGTENEGKFAIDPATGRITVKAKLNFETAPDATGGRTGKEYTVTVSLFDPSTATGITQEVIIAVTDENDAPMRPTVGVVTDNNRTPLDPDDATAPSYKIDENTPVKDVAEDTNVTPNIAAEFAIVIATFTVTDGTDPDGGTSATEGDPADTLKLTVEGVDGGLFDLTNTTAAGGDATDDTYELVFKEEPNYESPADADGNNRYHVTIVTTDNEGAKSSLPLVITVENVEETGMVSLSTTQPAVGQAITASLTDPDMKISDVEWQWSRSLTDTPGSFIAIQGATSDTYTPIRSVEDDPITSENEGVDGDEGMYLEVTVSYRDNASEEGTAGDREIKKPTDNAVRKAPEVNQEPVFESGITREVRENAGEGGKVGSPVTAADPDGDALTYRISGGADMGAFKIDNNGQITVGKGTKLDYEGTQRTYVIEVTARDPFGLEDSTTVTITVTDFNEKPELTLQPGGSTAPSEGVVGGRSSVSVVEGTTAVGTYTTTITNPSWNVSGADAGDFSISGGALSFRSAPDYEAPADADTDNVYEVTVVASNGGATSATLAVTVTVTNDPSDDATGGGFDALASYDANGNGQIDRPEVIMAIRDYFDDQLTRDNVVSVIQAYFAN